MQYQFLTLKLTIIYHYTLIINYDQTPVRILITLTLYELVKSHNHNEYDEIQDHVARIEKKNHRSLSYHQVQEEDFHCRIIGHVRLYVEEKCDYTASTFGRDKTLLINEWINGLGTTN